MIEACFGINLWNSSFLWFDKRAIIKKVYNIHVNINPKQKQNKDKTN